MTERHALVTGAASGIGRAIAARLADEGCRVTLCDLDEARPPSDTSRITCISGAPTCNSPHAVIRLTKIGRAMVLPKIPPKVFLDFNSLFLFRKVLSADHPEIYSYMVGVRAHFRQRR